MTIISITEVKGRSLAAGDGPAVSCDREYIIRSSILNEDENVVRLSADLAGNFLPPLYAVHPFNPLLRCTNVTVKQYEDDGNLWKGTVRWSALVLNRRPRASSSDPDKHNDNPLLRPALLKWGNESFQRALRKDLDGKEFRNAAGDWLDPAYMFDDSRGTFTITKNVPPPWNQAEWQDAKDVVSDAPFIGYPKGAVKLKSIVGDEGYENQQFFYTKVATFQMAEATNRNATGQRDWIVRIPNRGYHYLDNTGKLQPIVLSDGSRPSVPQNLGPDGQTLDPSDPVHYLEFRVFDDYDFSTLGLGL